MNTKTAMGLSGLLLAATLTTPALADTIEGRVATTLKDKVLIRSGAVTYVVKDGDLSYIRAFDRSRRKVKLDATVGKPVIDKDSGALRPLTNVKILDRVESADRTGTVSHRYDGAVILNTKQGPHELTRVPRELIAPLTGQKVSVSGLLFTDGPIPELSLTGMTDSVTKKGYLTQRKELPSGKMDYDKVADVLPGQPVTVIGLEGWNTKEKTSAHAADMDADDMLFAYVRTADGKHGFIPAYKLGLGSIVDKALRPFKRSTKESRQKKAQQQLNDAIVVESKKARQAEIQVSGPKKKGVIGSLEQDNGPPNMDDMPQQQRKID